eukprot:15790092-Heterocapsa_arctica.AAC.1
MKLRFCATLSAFCEESNGDSTKTVQKHSKTFKHKQKPSKPLTPVRVRLKGPLRTTWCSTARASWCPRSWWGLDRPP